MIMKTINDCNRVMQESKSAQLANDVRIVPDRTFNQREEARLFRVEKEKQEQEDLPPTTSSQGGGGRGRGRGKGPGRPKGRGGRGRGGSTGRGGFRTDSRKRRHSGDLQQQEEEELENKRRKVKASMPESVNNTQQSCSDVASSSSATENAEATPTQPTMQPARGRPGTLKPTLSLAAAATDGEKDSIF